MKLVDWWCECGFVFAPCFFVLGVLVGLLILELCGMRGIGGV